MITENLLEIAKLAEERAARDLALVQSKMDALAQDVVALSRHPVVHDDMPMVALAMRSSGARVRIAKATHTKKQLQIDWDIAHSAYRVAFARRQMLSRLLDEQEASSVQKAKRAAMRDML